MDSYLLRQNICGMSNNLNKALAAAIAHIDAGRYAQSLESHIMAKKGKDKFPRDPAFGEMLKQSHLYESAALCRYTRAARAPPRTGRRAGGSARL